MDEVLTKDSAEELEEGNNPGPMTEIQFWESKRINLESLFEQVHSFDKYLHTKTVFCFNISLTNTYKLLTIS